MHFIPLLLTIERVERQTSSMPYSPFIMLVTVRAVSTLEKMQRTFDRIIEKYRHLGRSIEVETIGIRPCMKGVDPAAQEQLEEMGADLIRTYTDREPKRRTGSTDANTFQAYGIPSIVLGTAIGGSTHTREEWLDPKSLKEGLRLALGAVWQIW